MSAPNQVLSFLDEAGLDDQLRGFLTGLFSIQRGGGNIHRVDLYEASLENPVSWLRLPARTEGDFGFGAPHAFRERKDYTHSSERTSFKILLIIISENKDNTDMA
jgi:hypothetical protein